MQIPRRDVKSFEWSKNRFVKWSQLSTFFWIKNHPHKSEISQIIKINPIILDVFLFVKKTSNFNFSKFLKLSGDRGIVSTLKPYLEWKIQFLFKKLKFLKLSGDASQRLWTGTSLEVLFRPYWKNHFSIQYLVFWEK